MFFLPFGWAQWVLPAIYLWWAMMVSSAGKATPRDQLGSVGGFGGRQAGQAASGRHQRGAGSHFRPDFEGFLPATEREREREMAKAGLGKTAEFFKRRDEWRKHPMLSSQLRHATPGLGIALVAFGIYLVGEAAYNRLHTSSNSHSS